ncbi:MAG TPA: terminase family protein [Candidatus Thermoplasmatota archaeon]|jgi:hypothetical protein|nr:terminase family protein [Candidatus Thermoplasmatota archaeon]
MTRLLPDDPLARMRAAHAPAEFSRRYLGWSPFPHQEEVMDAVLLHGARRVAWVAGRRAGKTEAVANIAVQLAVTRPGLKIAIFAPSARQAHFLSRKVKWLLRGSPFEQRITRDTLAELKLGWGTTPGGKPIESIIFANSMTGNVRGEGADVLIVDESAFCKGEDYRNKALPFVSDKSHAIIIHISTYNTEDDHFAEAVRIFPTLPHGRKFESPSWKNPQVTQEWLDEMGRMMLASERAREFECKLLPDSGVFDRRALNACSHSYELLGLEQLAKLEPKRHHRYHVGVDWGKKQDRAVIAAVEQGTQEKVNPARLVFLHTYEPDPHNPRHYTRVIDDIKAVAQRVGATTIRLDEGEGAHQAEVLDELFRGKVKTYRFTAGSVKELIGKARLMVERGAVELPIASEEVRAAFANVVLTEKSYEHASRRSKDVFDAIALALWDTDRVDRGEGGPRLQLLKARPGSSSEPPEVWQATRATLRAMVPQELWGHLDREMSRGTGG